MTTKTVQSKILRSTIVSSVISQNIMDQWQHDILRDQKLKIPSYKECNITNQNHQKHSFSCIGSITTNYYRKQKNPQNLYTFTVIVD